MYRYCSPLQKLGVPHHESRDWRLFIDGSKRSLKCVLLHNGNRFALVSLAYSTLLKEKYDSVKYVLEKSLTVNTSGIYVFTLKWLIFYWGNSLDLPSTLAFCACRIVGTDLSTIPRRTGLHEMK